ncbi:MAG: hypothetical protein COA78_34040 [Blastopirellula sp.]|nr:MAG: hypothetical protein COA78_34040 [Blastopirellula sp.]
MTEEPINPYQTPECQEQNLRFDDNPDRLVVLATFNNLTEASCLVSELEQNGIASRTANEQSGSTLGSLMSTIWIEVLVMKEDADRALAVKEKANFSTSEAESIPEWTCTCGETVDAGFEQCWSCLKPFEPNEVE